MDCGTEDPSKLKQCPVFPFSREIQDRNGVTLTVQLSASGVS